MTIDEQEIARRAFILAGLIVPREEPSPVDVEFVAILIEDMISPSRVAEQLIAAQMVPWRTKANLG